MSVVKGRYDVGFSIRVPHEFLAKVRTMCTERRISQGELIRRLVDQEFDGFSELQERRKSASSVGIVE